MRSSNPHVTNINHEYRFQLLSSLCSECSLESCNHNHYSPKKDDSDSELSITDNVMEVTTSSKLLKQSQIPSSPSLNEPCLPVNSFDSEPEPSHTHTEPISKHTFTDINFKHRGIYFWNLNIRHLKAKIDDIRIILSPENGIDVFGICETFLNPSIDDISISLNGYKIERKDRCDSFSESTGNGGGVLIYVADHIDFVRRNDLESADVESIWIGIKIKNNKSF